MTTKSQLKRFKAMGKPMVAPVPLSPTEEMIDAGAQRLVQWQDDSVWPDSWSPIQRAAARNDAERVWLSMWLAAPKGVKP